MTSTTDALLVREHAAQYKTSQTSLLKQGLVKTLIHQTDQHIAGIQLVEILEKGLPISELDALKDALEVPFDQLPHYLAISKATLQRRKKDGKPLGPTESDRVIRFARLIGDAVETFDGLKAARNWLKSPQIGLGGEIPLNYARTEVGAREVEVLLGRIDYGVYA